MDVCANSGYLAHKDAIPDSKDPGAYMGPTWGRQDPGGPHVGPMDFAIWDIIVQYCKLQM